MLYPGAGLTLRFADPSDGWIEGGLAVPPAKAGTYVSVKATLWSTHDGGRTWRKQRLPGLEEQGAILDLEAAAGTVYRMETNDRNAVTLESSPVTVDRWRVDRGVHLGLPAGGGELSGAIVLQGKSGWLVEGNDRGVTGSARLGGNGRWVAWTSPCASVGDSFTIPAASTPRNLVAECVMGGFASPLSEAAPHGAALESTWLYVSDDGGKRFEAVRPELGTRGDYFGPVLASPKPGVILVDHGAGKSDQLRASFDGGKHWAVVHRGELSYLGFTTPTQGVGIVLGSRNGTTMIMTFDGGRHWAPVSF